MLHNGLKTVVKAQPMPCQEWAARIVFCCWFICLISAPVITQAHDLDHLTHDHNHDCAVYQSFEHGKIPLNTDTEVNPCSVFYKPTVTHTIITLKHVAAHYSSRAPPQLFSI